MGGIDMLLLEFDEQDLPEPLVRQFKELALALKDLPVPRNAQAVRRLLDARRVTAHAHHPLSN
jgi:hypothetical protein